MLTEIEMLTTIQAKSREFPFDLVPSISKIGLKIRKTKRIVYRKNQRRKQGICPIISELKISVVSNLASRIIETDYYLQSNNFQIRTF